MIMMFHAPGSPSLPSDVGCGHEKMGTSSLASGRPMPATPVTGRLMDYVALCVS